MKIRPEVQWFAEQMEKKLQQNDHKKHWSTLNQIHLFTRLHHEMVELREAIAYRDPSEVVKEAADVANFCLFIADNAGTWVIAEEDPNQLSMVITDDVVQIPAYPMGD